MAELLVWTKGYLTGGLHPSRLEEWDALYRLEGARRKWRAHRWYYQDVNERFLGVSPYIVTWRHAIPNPAYAEELRGRRAAAEAERRRRNELWAEKGWATYRDRARWVVRERFRGRTLSAIGADAGISKSFVSQLVGAERRRYRAWRSPRGRVFDPDPMLKRDTWLTWSLGDDMNVIPDY